MPLRPFPLGFSIGTDIVHVNRIRALLVKAQDEAQPQYLDRFLRRFLTPREQHVFSSQYLMNGRLVDGGQLDVVSKHLAGRWAAKEATIKAVSWRRLRFHQIVIQPSPHRQGLMAVILDDAASASAPAPEPLPGDDAQPTTIIPEVDFRPLVEEHMVREEDVGHDELTGQIARISISHDGDYATAVCLAAEEPVSGDVGGEAAARALF